MLKRLLTVIISACVLIAQAPVCKDGQPCTTLLFYSGTTLTATCEAISAQPRFYWSRNTSTLTSIVDSSNTSTVTTSTAHGLAVGNKVLVEGASIDPDLNGSYVIATVPSSTTFTFTSASVSDATYTESTLRISTTAPRSTAAIWRITAYTTTTTLDAVQTAEPLQANGQICANRAQLGAQ